MAPDEFRRAFLRLGWAAIAVGAGFLLYLFWHEHLHRYAAREQFVVFDRWTGQLYMPHEDLVGKGKPGYVHLRPSEEQAEMERQLHEVPKALSALHEALRTLRAGYTPTPSQR